MISYFFPACSPSNTDITIEAQGPGEISTPVFPDGSRGITCTWKIQAPENFQLEIKIKTLKLNGRDDYLVIRDGADTNSPRIGNYGWCTTGSLTLFSSGSSLFLQTVSAVFSVNDKLKIAYKPIKPGKSNLSWVLSHFSLQFLREALTHNCHKKVCLSFCLFGVCLSFRCRVPIVCYSVYLLVCLSMIQ